MTDNSTLRIVLLVLGVSLVLCLAGIIFLAYVGDRPIPDVLVAVPTGILGLLGGILVPNGTRTVHVEDVSGRHEA